MRGHCQGQTHRDAPPSRKEVANWSGASCNSVLGANLHALRTLCFSDVEESVLGCIVAQILVLVCLSAHVETPPLLVDSQNKVRIDPVVCDNSKASLFQRVCEQLCRPFALHIHNLDKRKTLLVHSELNSCPVLHCGLLDVRLKIWVHVLVQHGGTIGGMLYLVVRVMLLTWRRFRLHALASR